jgi:hypothetical protein
VKLKILWKLLKKKLGFRMLMDVIPLDATLVKGSHGCRPASATDWPVFIAEQPSMLDKSQIDSIEVYELIHQVVR